MSAPDIVLLVIQCATAVVALWILAEILWHRRWLRKRKQDRDREEG